MNNEKRYFRCTCGTKKICNNYATDYPGLCNNCKAIYNNIVFAKNMYEISENEFYNNN